MSDRSVGIAILSLAVLLSGCGLTPDPSGAAPSPASGAPLPSETPPSVSTAVPPSPSPGIPDATPSVAPTPSPVAGLAAGWHHAVTCNGRGRRCRVHLFDGGGREVPGWPVAMPGRCWSTDVATGPDGTAYAACSGPQGIRVGGITTRGQEADGWPVQFAGESANIDLAPDGTVVVGVSGPGRRDYELTALDARGQTVRGWPVNLPGGAQGFEVAADGGIVAWWYEGITDGLGFGARRTGFTRLDRRGNEEPGWPIGSAGAALGPIVLDDGGILYTAESGRVWRHDRTGAVQEGWPFLLPDAVWPIARGDRFAFVGLDWVTMLRPDGREAEGWPWRTSDSLAGPNCDTDGMPAVQVAWGAENTLYLAPQSPTRSQLVALDARGRPVPGWPVEVPGGWVVQSLRRAPGGGVKVRLGNWCLQAGSTVTFDERGRLADGSRLPDGTSLREVYEALRLDDIRTDGGGTSFSRGSPVTARVDLVNTTEGDLELARGDDGGFAAGSVWAYLRRLGPDPTIDCLDQSRGHWHHVDWMPIESREPMVLAPGEPASAEITLGGTATDCLAPGAYQLRVEYRAAPSHGFVYGTLDSATLNLTITDGP